MAADEELEVLTWFNPLHSLDKIFDPPDLTSLILSQDVYLIQKIDCWIL